MNSDSPLFIMRTCGMRPIAHFVDDIPDLFFVHDKDRNAYHTFQDALRLAIGHDAVHMEDDAVLCNNFYEKCLAEVLFHSDEVIQFFTRRKEDLTKGSRYMKGAGFSMNICFYIPASISKALYEYSYNWPRIKEHPTGYDLMMGDFFKENKIDYWAVVPNIVDHAEGKSCIDPRRSSKRQSLTFIK